MKRAINYVVKMVVCMLLSMLATSVITIIWAIIDSIPNLPSYMVYMSRFDRFISEAIDLLPAALLFGLFISPSITIYYVLDFFHKDRKAKTIGYIIPILVIFVVFAVGLIFAIKEKCSEGEDQMATFILTQVFVAGVVVYVCMSKIKWLR